MKITKEILASIREHPDTNRIISVDPGHFSSSDLYRMVASVEECNARFEAFVFPIMPLRFNLFIGFQIIYSEHVEPGEVFAGMFSDLKDGKVQHGSAFVRLVYDW